MTTRSLAELFGGAKPLIGNVHLPALPGSPRYDGESIDDICEYAVSESASLLAGGINGIMIENAGDLPYSRPEHIGHETAAALAVVTREVARAVSVPIGITCVANGTIPALAAAKAGGATFIRANIWVTAYIANEGFIEADAARTVRYARSIGAADVLVLADVKVKFGAHSITDDRGIAEIARDAQMQLASAIVVTGTRTGSPTSVEDVAMVKEAVEIPVLVGSGLGPANAAELMAVADGAIVGASLKHGGHWANRVDVDRVRALVGAAL